MEGKGEKERGKGRKGRGWARREGDFTLINIIILSSVRAQKR